MHLRDKILAGLQTIPLVAPSMQPEIALLEEHNLLSRWRLRGAVRSGDWRLARAAAIALVSLWDRRSARVLWQRVLRDGWSDPEAALCLGEMAFYLNRDRWTRYWAHVTLRQLQASRIDSEREFLLRVLHLCGVRWLADRCRQVAKAEALRVLHESGASAQVLGTAVDVLAAACGWRDSVVAELLDHPEPEVRRRAAAAVGNLPVVTDDWIARLCRMAAEDHEASAGIGLPVSRTARVALARIECQGEASGNAAAHWSDLALGSREADAAGTTDLSDGLMGALSLMPPQFQRALKPAFERLAGSGLCSYAGLQRLLASSQPEDVETAARAIGCLGLIELVPHLWQVALEGDGLTADVRTSLGITAERLDPRQSPAIALRMATALRGEVGPTRQEAYLRLLAILAFALPKDEQARLAAVAANCSRDREATPAVRHAAEDLVETLEWPTNRPPWYKQPGHAPPGGYAR